MVSGAIGSGACLYCKYVELMWVQSTLGLGVFPGCKRLVPEPAWTMLNIAARLASSCSFSPMVSKSVPLGVEIEIWKVHKKLVK